MNSFADGNLYPASHSCIGLPVTPSNVPHWLWHRVKVLAMKNLILEFLRGGELTISPWKISAKGGAAIVLLFVLALAIAHW